MVREMAPAPSPLPFLFIDSKTAIRPGTWIP
jgi:hypothetical protein